MSATEDKTIFEELLERSPEQKAEDRKTDRAYHLVSQGYWAEADALFDEILAEEPNNSEALMGKKLISRKANINERMDSLGVRAYKATAHKEKGDRNPLHKKTVVWIIIVVFLFACGIAAASVLGVLPGWADITGKAEPTPTVEPTATVEPTEDVKSAQDIYNDYIEGLTE